MSEKLEQIKREFAKFLENPSEPLGPEGYIIRGLAALLHAEEHKYRQCKMCNRTVHLDAYTPPDSMICATCLYRDAAAETERLEVVIEKIDIFKMIYHFQHYANQTYSGPPRLMPEEYLGRFKLTEEEFVEWRKAVKSGDLENYVMESLDIIYCILGNFHMQGIPFYECWQALHNANMTREVVPHGQGKYGMSINKGPNYQPPQLSQFVSNQPPIE
jgi:hypothetical protein